MPVAIPLNKMVIRKEGVFDFDGLYKMIVQWLKARRFWFSEKTFKHRPGTEFGREEEIYWNASREVDNYQMWDLDIYFHIWDLSKVEVTMKDGTKKMMSKCRLEIWLTGNVIIDYQGRWERSKFHLALRSFYHKYVLKPDLVLGSIMWDTLYYRMFRLHDHIKNYLEMSAAGYEYRRYTGDTW